MHSDILPGHTKLVLILFLVKGLGLTYRGVYTKYIIIAIYITSIITTYYSNWSIPYIKSRLISLKGADRELLWPHLKRANYCAIYNLGKEAIINCRPSFNYVNKCKQTLTLYRIVIGLKTSNKTNCSCHNKYSKQGRVTDCLSQLYLVGRSSTYFSWLWFGICLSTQANNSLLSPSITLCSFYDKLFKVTLSVIVCTSYAHFIDMKQSVR